MLRRLYALIVKELIANWRDKQTRMVLTISPIVQILLFSFAATQEVRNVSLAVVNQDWGGEARELVARFEGAPTVTDVRHLRGVAEIAPTIDARKAMMILHIGPEFSRQVQEGRTAEVQLILDGRHSNTAQILQGYATRIVEQFNGELAARRGGGRPASLVVARVWFNPNLETLWSTVPGLFAILTTVVGIMVSSLVVARERELGTFEQLLVSPLSSLEIVAGKATAALLIALALSTIMLLLAAFVLRVPVIGSVPLLYLGIAAHLGAVIGLGLFISSLAATQQQAIIGAFTFMAPSFLLSGFASPIENMPGWLRAVNELNPVRHFVLISKGTFLKDIPAGVVIEHLWPLLAIALVTLSAGAWLFRHKLH